MKFHKLKFFVPSVPGSVSSKEEVSSATVAETGKSKVCPFITKQKKQLTRESCANRNMGTKQGKVLISLKHHVIAITIMYSTKTKKSLAKTQKNHLNH